MPNGLRDNLMPGLRLFGLLTLLTGVFYPLVVTGIAQAVFPGAADGSLIFRGQIPVGSRLIGQDYHNPAYFWGRPSATSPACNAAASSGSNRGPSNPDLFREVQDRAARLSAAAPGRGAAPADLLTASASGLDPHISPAAALFQVPRVARARRVAEAPLRQLIGRLTEGRQLGILGEPRVNVLELNLALDRLTGQHPPDSTTVAKNGTIFRSQSGS